MSVKAALGVVGFSAGVAGFSVGVVGSSSARASNSCYLCTGDTGIAEDAFFSHVDSGDRFQVRRTTERARIAEWPAVSSQHQFVELLPQLRSPGPCDRVGVDLCVGVDQAASPEVAFMGVVYIDDRHRDLARDSGNGRSPVEMCQPGVG